MRKAFYIFLALFVFLPAISFAQENVQKEKILYFYADWCPHCQKVNKFFEENGFYQKYDIEKLNFDSPMNKTRLMNLAKEKGISEGVGIPTILVKGELVSGDQPIMDYFEGEVEKKPSVFSRFWNFLAGLFSGNVEEVKGAQSVSASAEIPMLTLIGAALVDAINPCAFAVLILLIATVLNAQGKRKALFSGLLFSLAVFISYILMGLGVYKAITIFNLPKVFSLAIGIISIIIGLANLKDFFWYGKVFVMEVPFSWRPKLQSIVKHVTSPFGALTSGFLVSLFLLPCTSGPYMVILGLLAERAEMAKTVSLLILYNLIFIAPMILITLAVSQFGVKAGKLEAWRQQNLRSLHLVAGIIMVAIGVYLISGWI